MVQFKVKTALIDDGGQRPSPHVVAHDHGFHLGTRGWLGWYKNQGLCVFRSCNENNFLTIGPMV